MINNIIKFIKKRWQAKLGSILIAIIFYFYVQYTKTITKTFYLKVEPPNLPNHLTYAEEPPAFIKVEFYGPEELMDIEKSNFKLLMVNTGPTSGKNRFRLELIPPPPSMIHVRLEPPEVEIVLDNKKRKYLPLIPQFDLPENKKVVYWKTNPISIMIEGPEKVITKMDRLKLNPVKLLPNSNLYYSRVMLQELPRFTKLVENQPFEIQLEIKYFSEKELQEKMSTISSDYYIFEEEIPVQCSNNLERLELENNPKIKLTYISRYYLTKNFFIAEVYCPVEWNSILQVMEPNTYIPSLPVQLRFLNDIKELEILKLEPLTVDLQFRLKKKSPVNQLEKGLQEHLIR